MKKRFTTATLGLLLGLASAAHAAPITLFEGDLFYTTFNAQSAGPAPNVYKTHFLYDDSPNITLSSDCLVASLTGADGLIFDPNDATKKTLIVGEQSSNLVASITVGANPCPSASTIEKRPDGSQAASGSPGLGQAYGLATPDNGHLWMLPNDTGPKPDYINVTTLPLTADGVSHQVTGVDGINAGPNPILTGVTFIGTQGYYGDALDYYANGHFGTISSAYVTARMPVYDDVTGPGNVDLNDGGIQFGQATMPTHGMTYDSYSGCIIASGANQIWQICPPGVAGGASDGRFHVRAKIETAPGFQPGQPALCLGPSGNIDCNVTNWDQTSTDNAGHLFGANNNGDLIFVDYSKNAGKLINNQKGGTAPFIKEQYLRETLDDIVNGGGAPPPPPGGCPATQGFWHKAANWTDASATVGGISYNGATHEMTIGGITYSQTKLLLLMPSGSLHSGNFNNSLSQTIAAVLNVAAGATTTPAAIAAISGVNTAMTGIQIFSGNNLNPAIPAATKTAVQSYLTALDNYNSAQGLGCTEGVGLNIGGGKKK